MHLPDLKQNFGTHRQKAIHNSEREYQWHGIDVPRYCSARQNNKGAGTCLQAQEPRQRGDRELDVDFVETIVNDREALVYERFKDTLVQ